jgi:hypothetical protein
MFVAKEAFGGLISISRVESSRAMLAKQVYCAIRHSSRHRHAHMGVLLGQLE